MGANMVNQMGMANASMGAGAAAPPPIPNAPTAVAFHVAVAGAQTGPFDLAALQAQASAGQLKRDSLVWRAGMAQWVKADSVPELGALFANVPPPLPPAA
jgi:hypothetical protein